MKCSIPFYRKLKRNHEKYYDYVINIQDKNGVCRIVHRRYNDFFKLQHRLLELFPAEGGAAGQQRSIPTLPGKVLIRTVKERDIAADRRPQLERFCNEILKLPVHISQHELVCSFFQTSIDDVSKTAEAKEVREDSEISAPTMTQKMVVTSDCSCRDAHGAEFAAKAGDQALALTQSDTGYWFVKIGHNQGWLPAQNLAPAGANGAASANALATSVTTMPPTVYVCVRDFDARGRLVAAGQLVSVVRKDVSGWWQASHGSVMLLLPAVYLRLANSDFVDQQLILPPVSPSPAAAAAGRGGRGGGRSSNRSPVTGSRRETQS